MPRQLESTSAVSYRPGVYMLTGVNGIGKSTIVDAIAKDHPEVLAVHASNELRGLFDGVSREELESLSAEEKLGRMVTHFTSIFERAQKEEQPVLMDTHLLVPIRKGDELTYENIWSDEYGPYTTSVAMITADPSDIRDWRVLDGQASGRKRNTCIEDIAADQQANVEAFNQLRVVGSLPVASELVYNSDGLLETTRAAVEQIFIGQ